MRLYVFHIFFMMINNDNRPSFSAFYLSEELFVTFSKMFASQEVFRGTVAFSSFLDFFFQIFQS